MAGFRKEDQGYIDTSKLNISTDELTNERAHRAGRKDPSGRPRTIVAKFQNYKVKEAVLKNKKGLKGTNIFVREDFSQRVLARRKELLPQMHEERRKGNIAFLRYDKLVVYSGRSRNENQARSLPTSPSISVGRGRPTASMVQFGEQHHQSTFTPCS